MHLSTVHTRLSFLLRLKTMLNEENTYEFTMIHVSHSFRNGILDVRKVLQMGIKIGLGTGKDVCLFSI